MSKFNHLRYINAADPYVFQLNPPIRETRDMSPAEAALRVQDIESMNFENALHAYPDGSYDTVDMGRQIVRLIGQGGLRDISDTSELDEDKEVVNPTLSHQEALVLIKDHAGTWCCLSMYAEPGEEDYARLLGLATSVKTYLLIRPDRIIQGEGGNFSWEALWDMLENDDVPLPVPVYRPRFRDNGRTLVGYPNVNGYAKSTRDFPAPMLSGTGAQLKSTEVSSAPARKQVTKKAVQAEEDESFETAAALDEDDDDAPMRKSKVKAATAKKVLDEDDDDEDENGKPRWPYPSKKAASAKKAAILAASTGLCKEVVEPGPRIGTSVVAKTIADIRAEEASYSAKIAKRARPDEDEF